MIFLILYTVGNRQDRLYYLQTACVMIVLIHGWIQPYKYRLLNVLDTTILVIIVLVVNITTFRFTDPKTITILILLIMFPLCLVCILFAKISLTTWMLKRKGDCHFELNMSSLASNQDQPATIGM